MTALRKWMNKIAEILSILSMAFLVLLVTSIFIPERLLSPDGAWCPCCATSFPPLCFDREDGHKLHQS